MGETKMAITGLSEEIRNLAEIRYVRPAIRAGKHQFSIRVRDVLNDLEEGGKSGAGRTPQVCSTLQTKKFLNANGLEIESVDGPPKKQSPTVVVHYRVRANPPASGETPKSGTGPVVAGLSESPSDRALRLTEKLRGLLKEEMASYGGGEAFLRWVRGHDEEDAA
jgi:hypothetical protein